MSKFLVAGINKGADSSTNAKILTVYSKLHETYAVYRTAEGVMVQYADDDAVGDKQRRDLLASISLKGEINGLIDGWQTSRFPGLKSKANIFSRRVADALVTALQGDSARACEQLTAIKADVLAERTSIARCQYVAFALAAVIASIIAVVWLAYPEISIREVVKFAGTAIAGGALGALFSIALGIRDRSLLSDLQFVQNLVDAISRIFIGAMSGVILLCLMKTGVLKFQLGTATVLGTDLGVFTVFAVSFVAGFSERLVGNMLRQVELSAASATNPLAGGKPPAAGGASDGNGSNPPGTVPAANPEAPPPPPPDDGADGCLADSPIAPGEHTADAELPEATGGVEKSP